MADVLIPTITIPNNISNNDIVPLLKEYAWNFEKNEPLVDDDGKFIILDGLEALQVRNYLSLNIYRGRFFIYNGEVGSRIKDLIGKSTNEVKLYLKTMLEEALIDEYVKSIDEIEIINENSNIIAEFNINSIYGTYTENLELGGV